MCCTHWSSSIFSHIKHIVNDQALLNEFDVIFLACEVNNMNYMMNNMKSTR